jgi:hypothetical protein
MRRHLLVTRRDEADPALAERVQKRDVRVPAQAEDDLDAQPLEVFGEQIRRDPRLGRARDFCLGDCGHEDVLASGSKISLL